MDDETVRSGLRVAMCADLNTKTPIRCRDGRMHDEKSSRRPSAPVSSDRLFPNVAVQRQYGICPAAPLCSDAAAGQTHKRSSPVRALGGPCRAFSRPAARAEIDLTEFSVVGHDAPSPFSPSDGARLHKRATSNDGRFPGKEIER